MINVYKSKNIRIGFGIKLVYQITAHQTEVETMHSIKAFFNNVGNIEYTADRKYVSYRVYKLKDIINVIIPHFELYPLQSSKYVYYYL